MAKIQFLERYEPGLSIVSSLLRFAVLFFIWGSVGFAFKVFMNLSGFGFVLSMLFFASCALVVLGFWTRSSMVLLTATLLVHGYINHGFGSMMCGLFAGLSALLPIGEYYSLDRFLKMGAKVPASYVPVGAATAPPLSPVLKAIFFALALFMVGGPAYNQIFHHQNMLFRSWDMFHKIGAHTVNVHFFYDDANGRREIDYMAELGEARTVYGINRRENRHYRADLLIVGPDQLEALIGRVCKASKAPAALRVEARIASMKDGWITLYKGEEPVCASHGLEVIS